MTTTNTQPATVLDGVAAKIYRECETLRNYGWVAISESIRNQIQSIVGWIPNDAREEKGSSDDEIVTG